MNIACCRLLAIALAGILDQIFGDPRVAWHPICLIGNLISWTEKWTRPLFPKTKSGERAAGVYLVVFVLLIATAAPVAITLGLYRLSVFWQRAYCYILHLPQDHWSGRAWQFFVHLRVRD